MSWHRPNIGSRMNREVHVRVWERAEVKFLRATRHSCQSRTAALAGWVRSPPKSAYLDDLVLGWRQQVLSITALREERLGRRDHHVGGHGSWRGCTQRRKQHLVVTALDGCATDNFDTHAGGPLPVEIERLGGSNREISDAVMCKRPAVIDPHDYRATIVQIGDTRITRQRHRAMRRRDAVHVIALAVRSPPAMEVGPIPGGNSFGAICGIAGRNIGRKF